VKGNVWYICATNFADGNHNKDDDYYYDNGNVDDNDGNNAEISVIIDTTP
jgi:hypothetical protein